jgi:hypothetical protein
VLQTVRDLRPDRVVLASNWVKNSGWRRVGRTIKRLQELGIPHIELVGPVPEWKNKLPKQLFLYHRDHPSHTVPHRMNIGLRKNFIALDPKMREFARIAGAEYLSPRSILCNDQGCLTRLGDSGKDLISWDDSHLTERGSVFLVSSFPGN